MFADLLISYKNQITSTIMPTILLLMFCQTHIYNGLKLKEKIVGFIHTLFTSYLVLYLLQQFAYHGLANLLTMFFTMRPTQLLCLRYLIYVLTDYLFAALFVKQFQYRNTMFKDARRIVPTYACFIYAQYLVIIYAVMIFADNVLQMNIYTVVLGEIWYLTFKNDFDKMSEIYSEKKLSPANTCLIFQVLLVIMVWFIPESFSASQFDTQDYVFFKWLKAVAVILYIFSLMVHKVIYLQSLHSYNEIASASTDNVTGAGTRRFLVNKGQEVLEKAKEEGKTIYVLYINVDGFRYINQDYGVAKGNQVLIKTAKYLMQQFSNGLVARLGDDHFAVITDNVDRVEIDLMQIRKSVLSELDLTNIHYRVGLCASTKDDKDIVVIIDRALEACYKTEKNNTISLKSYDEQLSRQEKMDTYILENVDRALSKGLIKVYYQPIIDLKTMKIVSAEALARWDDDTYGFLSPDKFIPILEKNNVVYKLDCFVAEQICRDQMKMFAENMQVYPVSFNISRKDFFITDMVDFVNKTVNKYALGNDLIKIEITESAFTDNDDVISNQIKRFKEQGYQVWMDDFGAGYSSLNALGNFRFDGIKLDMVFLKDITADKKVIMQGIIDSAKKMNITVLTEGVETEEQLELLGKMGCDMGQGFYFCKPLPLEDHIKMAQMQKKGVGSWEYL